MRDGSYIVNYSLVGNAYANAPPASNPSLASDSTFKTISMQSIEQHGVDQIEEWKPTTNESPTGQLGNNEDATMASGNQASSVSNGNASMSGTTELSEKSEDQLLDLVLHSGVGGIDLEADKRAFHKLLLGQVSRNAILSFAEEQADSLSFPVAGRRFRSRTQSQGISPLLFTRRHSNPRIRTQRARRFYALLVVSPFRRRTGHAATQGC
jgi:hypothetical protein